MAFVYGEVIVDVRATPTLLWQLNVGVAWFGAAGD